MNKRTENEQLLQDVLASEKEEALRGASLQNILRLARRRRQIRSARRVGVLGLVFLAGTLAAIRYFQPKQRESVVAQLNPPASGLVWVSSEPLSVSQMVTSQPLSSEQMVTSAPMPAIVHTSSGNYREVGDEELLALAAPQVVALVRRGPHEAELLFVSAPASGQDN